MWPDASETRALLDRVGQDDLQAADRLWERHREPLLRMIRARLGHDLDRRVDASDVVQDVLINASLRLRDYLRDPTLPFHVWLRQIAQDKIIDQHRRHRVAASRSMDRERAVNAGAFGDRSSLDLAGLLRDPALTPAAEAIRRELHARFRATLDRLDPLDRDILMLRHFDGLGNREAARALGLSDAAAGMRYLRALRRLRELLGESPSLAGVSRS